MASSLWHRSMSKGVSTTRLLFETFISNARTTCSHPPCTTIYGSDGKLPSSQRSTITCWNLSTQFRISSYAINITSLLSCCTTCSSNIEFNASTKIIFYSVTIIINNDKNSTPSQFESIAQRFCTAYICCSTTFRGYNSATIIFIIYTCIIEQYHIIFICSSIQRR